MIELKINENGKFEKSIKQDNLQQGEQYFRNVSISVPRHIHEVDISSYDAYLLVGKHTKKYQFKLDGKVDDSYGKLIIKYNCNIFPGITSTTTKIELGILWVNLDKQYLSDICEIDVNKTLLNGEIEDIDEFLKGYQLKVDEITSISKQVELQEKKRVENENSRIKEEDKRLNKFNEWIKKFNEFIEKNDMYSKNETQRISKMNEIQSEWNKLHSELSKMSVDELTKTVNDLKDKSLNHVKNIKVNTSKNTLDIYFEKDGTTPSLNLQLPKSFSGSYDDLTNKPDLTGNIREIDRKSDTVGTYVVYSNGMAEYIGYQTVRMAISSNYGASLYIAEYEWIYPIKFSERPAVMVTDARWSSGASWGIPQLIDNFYMKTRITILDVTSRAKDNIRLGIYVRGFVNLNDYKI